MKKIAFAVLLATAPLLGGCASESQDTYAFSDAGRSTLVEFGTVVQSRPVKITGDNSGAGTLAGGAAGAGLGSMVGGGNARIYTGIIGAVAGAVAGTATEQALRSDQGIEYTVATQKGKVLTIVQRMKDGERTFANGERVMVQSSGSYKRVLPAQNLPTEMQRPKGIKMVD